MGKKVFIHSSDSFPHGAAQTNYIQYLALICKEAGYIPVMIVRPNGDYVDTQKSTYYMEMKIKPIIASGNKEVHDQQRKNGFSRERIRAMEESGIAMGDVVITFELGYNINYHRSLQKFCEKVGVKTIVCVLEYWGAEDFNTKEKYEHFRYVADTLYLKYDGILVMSRAVEQHYKEKGKKVFLFPPFSECIPSNKIRKSSKKYSFLIISNKDSFESMIRAFADLGVSELSKIELHLCGVKEEHLRETIKYSEWKRLSNCVTIHPWMKYEKLHELYQQMHFLLIARAVCQRTLANFPSKVPETMTHGIVPIVSEVGDYTEYYLRDGKDSIFIKGDSVEETMRAIRKAIGMNMEEYERYSKKAYQTAWERFDYHRWIQQIKEMLETV